jgi:predicted DNA-binding transcriptional regulator YafY
MGSRDNYETVTRVIQAFAGCRTWKQAELAKHVGIQARALRRLLLSLRESGMPLDKDEEHPHVYWSVPPHWFPGGVIFVIEDWQVLVHAVLRIADPKRRQKLLGRLLAGRRALIPAASGVERLNQAVAAAPLTAEEHEMLLLVEQSLLEQVPLSIQYYSASRGELARRVISPQKLITEPHGRIAAFCHINKQLRWFRLDNIQRGHLERGQPRQEAQPEELDAFLASSVDGFRDGSEEKLAFRVRSPESSWVKGNLLPGMSIDQDAGGEGLRVVARGGMLVVARYIAGLGGLAVAEGEALKSLVRQLAEAAARANC